MRNLSMSVVLVMSLFLSVNAGYAFDATASTDVSAIEKSELLVRCSGTQLSLKADDGDADIGGKRYFTYTFTNISKVSCTLKGFPTFAALKRSGVVATGIGISYSNDFPNSSDNSKGAARKVITVEPGKTASFQIYYNDGMALSRRKPYPKAYKVRVTAPGGGKAFVVKSEIQSCCGIQVSSIHKDESQ